MTDAAWKIKIQNTVIAYHKYLALLSSCEKEYENRYGHNPSEVDDDYWIDLLHQGIGDVDIDRIKFCAMSKDK